MTFRRIKMEMSQLKECDVKAYNTVEYDEQNPLHCTVTLLPDKEPYSKGAFRVSIDFPTDYPFHPPKITFNTKIYHPNIDEKGQVATCGFCQGCMSILCIDNWIPATRTEHVLVALLELINEPKTGHPLRPDADEEFQKDREKFNKTAEEFTEKHAEKRPE